MTRSTRRLAASALGCAALAGLLAASGRGPETMRKKLEFAQGVLSGLINEDYDAIARNAKGLKAIVEAPEWTAPPYGGALGYPELTRDFRRALDRLEKGAAEKDLDGAALGYNQATTSCVNCHKFVRARLRGKP